MSNRADLKKRISKFSSEKPEEINSFAKALGQKGGQTTAKKYGTEHYKKISALGKEARRKKKMQREELLRKAEL